MLHAAVAVQLFETWNSNEAAHTLLASYLKLFPVLMLQTKLD